MDASKNRKNKLTSPVKCSPVQRCAGGQLIETSQKQKLMKVYHLKTNISHKDTAKGLLNAFADAALKLLIIMALVGFFLWLTNYQAQKAMDRDCAIYPTWKICHIADK